MKTEPRARVLQLFSFRGQRAGHVGKYFYHMSIKLSCDMNSENKH